MTMIDDVPLVLDEIADPWLARKVTELVEAGDARWVVDPEFDAVVGLQLLAHDDKPMVLVVYMDRRDFEVDSRFAAALAEGA